MAGGGEQDNGDGQSSEAISDKRDPIFGPIDAPVGAEHEFKKIFHDIPECSCTGKPGGRESVTSRRTAVQN
jgi:hypothetical protein